MDVKAKGHRPKAEKKRKAYILKVAIIRLYCGTDLLFTYLFLRKATRIGAAITYSVYKI
jgi:hypothetical protein